MSHKIDVITAEIFGVLVKHYPNISTYHAKGSIKEMIEYFDQLNGAKEKDAVFWLTYREKCRVTDFANIKENIQKIQYNEDSGKADFERGIKAAIMLIDHRIHCICD